MGPFIRPCKQFVVSCIFTRESVLFISSTLQKNISSALLLVLASGFALPAAQALTAVPRALVQQPPDALAFQGDVPAPPGVTDLKFGEFFMMPIGPRGLEASGKLMALAGKRVRILGYMARQETPVAGMFILAPLPVSLGDEDESLSDDLPASSVFVHVAGAGPVAYFSGLLRLTGTLSLGSHEESDGHVSTVRLELDPEQAQALEPGPADQAANEPHDMHANK